LPRAAQLLQLSILSFAACLLSSPVFADDVDDVIEEVIVTGEFRDTSVSQLAASVSVLLPEQNGESVSHLEEILGRAPNVNFSSGGSRARFFQVRGIGERGQFSEPLNASVGLLVDGVDLSGIGTAATLADVSQVEVFRGPQGTVFGANALAGLINVVTPDVADELSGSVDFGLGNYSAIDLGGVLSGPINDRVGFRISAHQYKDDGFIDNTRLGRDNTDNHDETTVRGKVAGDLDQGGWQVVFGSINVDNGYDAFSLDNDRNTRSDEPGSDTQESKYLGFKLDHNLNEKVALDASIAYVSSNIDYGYDEDWTFAGFDVDGYTATDLYSRDVDTATLDLRLLSRAGEGLGAGKVDWVVGFYAFDRQVDLTRQYTYLEDNFTSDFDVDRLALYGEVSSELAAGLRISVGLRAEEHSANYSDSESVSFAPDDNLLGGRILLEKVLADENLLYASLTRGYKSGGFNTSGSLDADLRLYDPETLWNLELGYKGSLLEDRLSLRAAVFRMQRRDVQTATSITRVRPNGSSEFIDYVGNAAEGINQGFEFELAFQASDRLQLSASLGLLDTQFEDYIDGSGQNLDGRDQAQAPSYQFYLSGDYQIAQDWALNINVEGKDDYYFSDSHAERSSSYELLNASIGYSTERWDFSLWGRNLADTDYFVRGFFFGNDPRDGYTARGFTQLGAPRQFGVSASANF
jgi:outer membrane receptor protein involved in Fe transport|tara:strand:- start:4224 stop:6302 length:2079 start_codon:yes stop_codon:yes gene_type:complete